MIKMKDILDEKDKRLREISKEVTFPLDEKDKKIINDMIKYLHDSQIEELSEKYNLRPGMGLAAIQLGIKKRYFVVVHEITTEEDTEQKFDTYILINPKMVSHSEEMICADAGEGCLSVNRETDGYVKNKTKLEETIEKMQNDWREINRKTAFYIEHDELEKVNSAMVKFKSFFSLEQYEEAISELENCRYILNHIKEKSALEIINLF